jgi:hypothetical protein
MALIAGVNKACITRLHATFKEINPKSLKVINASKQI